MVELLHRVKVFVFQQAGPEPAYLLLRGAQGLESFWGPVQGSIGFQSKPVMRPFGCGRTRRGCFRTAANGF